MNSTTFRKPGGALLPLATAALLALAGTLSAAPRFVMEIRDQDGNILIAGESDAPGHPGAIEVVSFGKAYRASEAGFPAVDTTELDLGIVTDKALPKLLEAACSTGSSLPFFDIFYLGDDALGTPGEAAHMRVEHVQVVAVDLVIGEGKAELAVGTRQCIAPPAKEVDMVKGTRRFMAKERCRLLHASHHALDHAVVEFCGNARAQRRIVRWQAGNAVDDAALETRDALKAAVARDISGLARPRRQGARSRHHQEKNALLALGFATRPVLQQALEHADRCLIERGRQFGEMNELCVNRTDARVLGLQAREQALHAEARQRGSAR